MGARGSSWVHGIGRAGNVADGDCDHVLARCCPHMAAKAGHVANVYDDGQSDCLVDGIVDVASPQFEAIVPSCLLAGSKWIYIGHDLHGCLSA